MNTLITYITLRRRRLRNLLFLLLQNEALSQSNYSNERFKTIFRVSRETFTNILGFIRNDLQREYLCETPISPEERLRICLYRLGRGDYYQPISELTGHGIVTVRNITQEVSNLIVTKLWKKFVVFPKTEEEF